MTLPVSKAPTTLRLDDSPMLLHWPQRTFDPCRGSSLGLKVKPQGSNGLHALSCSPIKQILFTLKLYDCRAHMRLCLDTHAIIIQMLRWIIQNNSPHKTNPLGEGHSRRCRVLRCKQLAVCGFEGLQIQQKRFVMWSLPIFSCYFPEGS